MTATVVHIFIYDHSSVMANYRHKSGFVVVNNLFMTGFALFTMAVGHPIFLRNLP
jgi:hypothetical protein